MKLADIFETIWCRQSNQLDKDELKDTNSDKARRIASIAKDKAKKANPGDGDTVTGWRSDPHQGAPLGTFLRR